MKRFVFTTGALAALALLFAFGGLAEDMPIVTDEPLTEAEARDAETERMAKAQQMLIDLNCLDGAADGTYGPKTASAIRLFQARNGLMETGELNDATYEALTLKAQAAGEAREVQQRLIDLSYLRGKADGIFGERSAAALKLFQAMAGLEATGEMDDATREALFADDARALPARLSVGDKGDGVQALQEKLKQYGFLGGKADGSYGKATAAAVKRFQKHLIEQGVNEDLGIAATGEATPATQALLFDPDYTSYLADIAAGDTGEEVERLERRLAQLGYMDAEADDAFDDYAAQALSAFRAASGLGEGVVADRAAVDALFAADVPQADSFVPHAIQKGDTGLAVRAAEAALVRGGMLIIPPNGRYRDAVADAVGRLHDYLSTSADPACAANAGLFEDPESLSVEAQVFLENECPAIADGRDDKAGLLRAQRRLHMLFYLDKAYIDGLLGSNTRSAIEAFQQANGLPATGELDAATRAALYSDAAVSKPLPYRVEVSIDDQRVYVYERAENGDYELTQTFICSTGLGDRTPRGVFLDGFPVNAWHHFEKFDCWAKYSFEIEGDIMFHSVLFDKDDDKTLRENSLYALGQKASHGCIRLKVADAKWLFTHCKRGTLAIVIY